MYNLTPLGEQRADSTDTPHNAEEAIPVVMKEHGTLESNEIATYLNMEDTTVESILRRLEKRGLVANLNPSEHPTVHTPGPGIEQQSTKVKVATGMGNATVGGVKKLGKLAIAITKHIAKNPGVIERAVVGNSRTSRVVFGPQERKQQLTTKEGNKFLPNRKRLERMRRDREAVLRGRAR